MMADRRSDNSDVVVVMVPFVAQGHLNQLLHLSRLISAYNIPVHFVTTTAHSRQAKLRAHGCFAPRVHFHEFPTPEFHCPPPDPYAPIKFPSHLLPSFNSTLHLREPVAQLIRSLASSSRRVVVIHDSLMSYVVQDVPSIPEAEAYIFHPLSAAYIFSYFFQLGIISAGDQPQLLITGMPSHEGTFGPDFAEFLEHQSGHLWFQVGHLYDTSRLTEGKYLDLLEEYYPSTRTDNISLRHWAIGPINPVEVHATTAAAGDRRECCLEFLDKQPANSVIYVSFGTTTTFTDEQVQEIAMGLEKSEQRFIWVLREADKGDVFSGDEVRRYELPEGFERRVGMRGVVVRDWAPQMEILAHPATGGFMTHCGWNSSVESISMGVPMATWPMHSDQPANAFLITEVLGVGVVVRDWARREEMVTGGMVETAVRKLMDSKEGAEIRKKAAELGDAVRRSVADGGVARKELDSFISIISR